MYDRDKSSEAGLNPERIRQLDRFSESVMSLTADKEDSVGRLLGMGINTTVVYPDMPKNIMMFVKRDYWEFNLLWKSVVAIVSDFDVPEQTVYNFYGLQTNGEFKSLTIIPDAHMPNGTGSFEEFIQAARAMRHNVALELDFVEECPTAEIGAINDILRTAVVAD